MKEIDGEAGTISSQSVPPSKIKIDFQQAKMFHRKICPELKYKRSIKNRKWYENKTKHSKNIEQDKIFRKEVVPNRYSGTNKNCSKKILLNK